MYKKWSNLPVGRIVMDSYLYFLTNDQTYFAFCKAHFKKLKFFMAKQQIRHQVIENRGSLGKLFNHTNFDSRVFNYL